MLKESTRAKLSELAQCASCPWRVDCVPDRDIPNGYSRDLHKKLKSTIAEPGSLLCSGTAMACHYSKPGEEYPCAGWLHQQIGAGNNIAARLNVCAGRWPVPKVDGPQHQTFAATLRPKRRRSAAAKDRV